jgi:hypothetical protein
MEFPGGRPRLHLIIVSKPLRRLSRYLRRSERGVNDSPGRPRQPMIMPKHPHPMPQRKGGCGRVQCSRTSIIGTAVSGRKPVSGRFSVRSDSFHRQSVQRLAGSYYKRELYACSFHSRLSRYNNSMRETTYSMYLSDTLLEIQTSWVEVPSRSEMFIDARGPCYKF